MKSLQYTVGYFFFLVAAHLLMPFNKKIRLGVLGRYKAAFRLLTLQIPDEKKVYWFHVASSGELEQVLPILDLLKEQIPQAYVFVTYFSPSGEKSIRLETARRVKNKKSIPWDYADYSLFDFKSVMLQVVKKIKPVAFIAIHREIWPGILMACKAKQVPSYLFSAYFPASSANTFWKYTNWIKYFKLVGTVDEGSVAFLKSVVPSLTAQKIGDSRIERVVSRRKLQSGPPPYATFFENQKVVVVGSVWPKDFDELIKAVRLHKDKRFIFVPHEPKTEFTNHIIESLKNEGLIARLWSRWLLEPDTTSQIVYDSVGGLFELYSIARFAFVGGGFVKRVHNVLEPAAYGLPILTGPLMENSREAIELLQTHGLFRCADGGVISKTFNVIDQQDNYLAAKENVERFIKNGVGASQKYVDLIAR